MKLFILLSMIFSSTTFASHIMCSGPHFYYSDVRADFGIHPQPGMKIGKTVIVDKGKVLMNIERLYGEGQHNINQYIFEMQEPVIEVIESEESNTGSYSLYRTSAVLKVIDAIRPDQYIEVRRFDSILCEKIESYVP